MATTAARINNAPLVALLCLLLGSLALVSARPAKREVSVENNGSAATAVSTNQTSSDPQGELLLVQTIFRHGDRTPISLYKNDPYNNYTWDEGLGQLTLRGKSRMYHFGETLNKRYKAYLDNILMKNVRAQSSPKRRCLETSLAVLAGLFPPQKSDVWSNNKDIGKLWQPIAVETTEPGRAWLLNPDTECAAATQIKDKLPTEDPEMKKFLEDNKEFVEKVTKFSGQQFPSWVQVGWVYDAIFTERAFFDDKFVMPTWLEQVGNDTLLRLKQFNDHQFSTYARWPKYVKLRAGLVLKQMIDNLKEAASQKEVTAKTKKMFTYGTHDTMINPIMIALGFSKDQPTYGSGIVLELRKDPKTAQPNVHVFYTNTTNNAQINDLNVDFVPLKLNQSERFSKLCHEAHCSLDNFATSLKDFLVDNIQKECALPKH